MERRSLLHPGGKMSPRDVRGSRGPASSAPTMYEQFNLTPNYFRFRISPEVTLAFGMNVIAPGEDTVNQSVEMIVSRQPRADEMDAYERVLGDAMAGDPTLFAREDYVEEALRIVDPGLKTNNPVIE